MSKYHYYMSSKTEPKHEISRKEFVKMLGESSYCVDQIKIVDGIYMDVANYERAESKLRTAQRKRGCTLWCCGSYSLYLQMR